MEKIGDILMQSPFFGFTLTLFFYVLGQKLYKVLKWSILQSILAAALMIIVVLKVTGIEYEAYAAQNQVLGYLLPVSVVALAVPLYKNLAILKKYCLPLILGIVSGTAATIFSLIVIGKLIGTDDMVILSMIPKSATNPIAIQVSEITGGIPSLTVVFVVIAGSYGGAFGPETLRLLRIKNDIAKGVAIGSMTHAVGTARAFKESELAGTVSGLALALAGTLTAFLSPVFAKIFF